MVLVPSTHVCCNQLCCLPQGVVFRNWVRSAQSGMFWFSLLEEAGTF